MYPTIKPRERREGRPGLIKTNKKDFNISTRMSGNDLPDAMGQEMP
jgi:hypothetical protein